MVSKRSWNGNDRRTYGKLGKSMQTSHFEHEPISNILYSEVGLYVSRVYRSVQTIVSPGNPRTWLATVNRIMSPSSEMNYSTSVNRNKGIVRDPDKGIVRDGESKPTVEQYTVHTCTVA